MIILLDLKLEPLKFIKVSKDKKTGDPVSISSCNTATVVQCASTRFFRSLWQFFWLRGSSHIMAMSCKGVHIHAITNTIHHQMCIFVIGWICKNVSTFSMTWYIRYMCTPNNQRSLFKWKLLLISAFHGPLAEKLYLSFIVVVVPLWWHPNKSPYFSIYIGIKALH